MVSKDIEYRMILNKGRDQFCLLVSFTLATIISEVPQYPSLGPLLIVLYIVITSKKGIDSWYFEFSSPTPNVTWERMDAPMPSKVSRSTSGQEITIPDADYTDGGKYRCSATNSHSGHPALQRYNTQRWMLVIVFSDTQLGSQPRFQEYFTIQIALIFKFISFHPIVLNY